MHDRAPLNGPCPLGNARLILARQQIALGTISWPVILVLVFVAGVLVFIRSFNAKVIQLKAATKYRFNLFEVFRLFLLFEKIPRNEC